MHHSEIIKILSYGFACALVLGYITHKMKLSPIVGYLLAGFLIGPFSPGFKADRGMAMQLAEVGVILLMFGVGLHFQLKDLMAVKRIAIPGAIGRTLIATLLGCVVAHFFGWDMKAGLVLGMAVAVASTVVLLRVLMDNNVLDTAQGHVAIGWVVVEDIFTVLVLVLLPSLAMLGQEQEGGNAALGFLKPLGLALLKLGGLAVLMLVVGARVIPWMLTHVARTRSRELFTLTILAVAFLIATVSAQIFDASMALGAFLAGMIVARSSVSHQAAADALPMRDAFAVLFFVSVGMLFDPHFVVERPWMILSVLGIILIAKPLTALVIVLAMGYSVRTALTVAMALSQIGEFSFILAGEALRLELFSEDGYRLLVTCALISITASPLMFKLVGPLENMLRARPKLWAFINGPNERRAMATNVHVEKKLEGEKDLPRAVVVGYGPVGRQVAEILRQFKINPVIVDLNVDTIQELTDAGREAVYGDAGRRDILKAAGVGQAIYLLVTLPDSSNIHSIISNARDMNPGIKTYVRARYVGQSTSLEELGVTGICFEEAEVARALTERLLAAVQEECGVEKPV